MKMHEALETLPDGMWCRPVGLKGMAYSVVTGSAFSHVKRYTVCNPNGNIFDMTACVEYLTGEWEFVSPEQVEQERKK